MKYIEIDLDRAVELCKQEKEYKVFKKSDYGDLERVTALSGTFAEFVLRGRYFEQTEED